MAQLALGSAQFGLAYGLTSGGARVGAAEVAAILDGAVKAGITVLDTAAAYGTAEAVIGRANAAAGGALDSLRIVTKVAALPAAASPAERVSLVEQSLERSLQRLRRDRIHGLLMHASGDLLGSGGDAILARLREWKRQGRIASLGVSIYDGHEARACLERFDFDLIQVPINVFDQRLLRDGTLAALEARGVEVHARSALLQGLLLMAECELPAGLKAAAPCIARFRAKLATAGLTPLQGALAFVRGVAGLDQIVLGVHSAVHLAQSLAAFETPALAGTLDFSALAVSDPGIIDPRRWN